MTTARRTDLFAGAWDSPATIQCFDAIHHTCEIFGHRDIATAEFAQRACPIFTVIHWRQHSGVQQLTQLASVDSIAFATCIQQRVLARIADDDSRDVRL